MLASCKMGGSYGLTLVDDGLDVGSLEEGLEVFDGEARSRSDTMHRASIRGAYLETPIDLRQCQRLYTTQ